jgi:oxygen-independent coproporphyrinogen III oxidase
LESSESAHSLYVHVPFCTDKCLYCDFFSVRCRTVTKAVQEAVVDQTIRQADFLTDSLHLSRAPTIFVGGGTPSVLPQPLLDRLLAAFQALKPAEWTVEANPESVNEAFLDTCRSRGVTRLSVGVQSLGDERLRLLRRPCTRDDVLAALDLVSRRWDGELNFDYIAGIPGQTSAEVAEDLQRLLRFRPSHVSLYQLTTEPGTELEKALARGTVVPNAPELDEELWFQGRAELEGAGFQHYEISNFCLPGKECRHNLRYWRLEPYLGVGPSAVSTISVEAALRAFPESRTLLEHAAAVRLTTPRDFTSFLAGEPRRWNMEVEGLTDKDFLLETLMMGLRLAEGITRASFETRFGKTFEDLFPGLWRRWEVQGLAFPARDVLRLTDQGRLFLDALLGDVVDEAHAHAMPALAVSWPSERAVPG